MEALGEPQHRTQVNPRKADLVWVSVPLDATPDIQTRPGGSGGGGGGTSFPLTLRDLPGTATAVGDAKATTHGADTQGEVGSPHSSEKPSKDGGAKGVMD